MRESTDLHTGWHQLEHGETHIWYTKTARNRSPEQIQRCRALFDPSELQRLDSLKYEHLAEQYLATRALCRTVLSRYADVAPGDWRFRVGPYGRPEIAWPPLKNTLRFNLSNVRGMVVCGVTSQLDIGVDVEDQNRFAMDMSVAEKYFAADEIKALKLLPALQRQDDLLKMWVLKEAYLKATGYGLRLPLNSFSVDLPTMQIEIGVAAESGYESNWQLGLYRPDDGYWMGVAIRSRSGRVTRVELCEPEDISII